MNTLPERFWNKVDLTDACWTWMAATGGGGYGKFRVGSQVDGTRRCVQGHRWAYEHLVGPIPNGLQLDHLCRNRRCVNPDHLEPVTGKENGRRGREARGVLHLEACSRGHAYDESNTYVDPRGRRQCRECRALAMERFQSRR